MNSDVSLRIECSVRETYDEQVAAILRTARKLADQACDWATFYRKLLGAEGLVRATLTPAEYAVFIRSDAHATLQELLARLRRTGRAPDESPRVIFVRLPESVHASLVTEAHACETSLNKLCVTKLLAPVDRALVPQVGGSGRPARTQSHPPRNP